MLLKINITKKSKKIYINVINNDKNNKCEICYEFFNNIILSYNLI